jgi:hypothetical protein
VSDDIWRDQGVKRAQITGIYRIGHRSRDPNIFHFICHARQRKHNCQQDP